MERIDYKVKIAVIPIDTNFKIVFFIYFFEFYRISKKYYTKEKLEIRFFAQKFS